MKVKLIRFDEIASIGSWNDGLTLGNIYECDNIIEGEAFIINGEGDESILFPGEYEVIEE